MDEKRKKEAEKNFSKYLEEGLIKKQSNKTSKMMYLKNAELSLKLAEDLMENKLKPYLWIIVISYYSMFYIANAVLLDLGYKVGDKIVHKVTNECLIAVVFNKIKKGLLEEYEIAKDDALDIASIKSEEIINYYELELNKRSRFQYEMTESIKEQKALTSLKRARKFIFEMKKLLQT